MDHPPVQYLVERYLQYKRKDKDADDQEAMALLGGSPGSRKEAPPKEEAKPWAFPTTTKSPPS